MTSKNNEDYKPVKLNIPMLDKMLEGGLKKGELSIIMGSAGPPKTDFIRFLPIEKSNGYYMVTMPLELSDDITKKGVCAIQEMIEKMKEHGIDTSAIEAKKTVTRYEKLGDTVFPVTYHPNGMIFVDYPDKPFCKQIKDENNSASSTDK